MSNNCNHHHHAFDHHRHGEGSKTMNNIAIAFFLNAGFSIIELIGGWWTNSVAIQADAIHDFGDSLALAAALGLQFLSTAQARGRFTFGFKRLSLLSALATSAILFFGSIYILSRAVDRLLHPAIPELNGMFGLAILGVLVNGMAAWKMSRGQTQSEKALTWHMIEDLLGWISVLVGSIAMRVVEAPWIDPVLSLVIAGIVLVGAARNFWTSSQLFLQAAPSVDFEKIRSEILKISELVAVNSIQAWSLDGSHHVASIHAKIAPDLTPGRRTELKQNIRQIFNLSGNFDVTIEWDEDPESTHKF